MGDQLISSAAKSPFPTCGDHVPAFASYELAVILCKNKTVTKVLFIHFHNLYSALNIDLVYLYLKLHCYLYKLTLLFCIQ